jgi:cytidylate kinase
LTVWTISAQEGTGADQVAAELAAAAEVPLVDRNSLAILAHDVDPDHFAAEEFDEIEQRLDGRFKTLALSMALISGPASGAAAQELQFRQRLPELACAVLTEAARRPCVILAPAAFVALREHPAAIHARLRAPVACRVAAYQREHLANRDCAQKAVAHDDRVKHDWVRKIFRTELDDDSLFTLTLDTSRFTRERLVNTLLAAGGMPPPAPAGASAASVDAARR